MLSVSLAGKVNAVNVSKLLIVLSQGSGGMKVNLDLTRGEGILRAYAPTVT